LFGSSAINLVDLFSIRIESVKTSKLTLLVSKEQQKMRTIATVNYIKDTFAGFPVDGSGEDDVLDSVENDAPIGLGCWFTIKTSASYSGGFTLKYTHIFID